MKKELFKIYNALKKIFVEKIEDNIEGLKLNFSPYIKISFPRDSHELHEEILSVEYDAKEDTWCAHNYITDMNLDTTEYWTPLRDLSFEELFKIAERIK